MRIPKRPTQLRTTLRQHAGQDDAPVFVYRFPTPEEEAAQVFEVVDQLQADPAILARLQGLRGDALAGELESLLASGDLTTRGGYARDICGLFDRQLEAIEHLDVDEEPFDRTKHLGDVPGNWKLEVGQEIQLRLRSYLTELEQGNSSWPSSSDDEPMALTSTADAADDAS